MSLCISTMAKPRTAIGLLVTILCSACLLSCDSNSSTAVLEDYLSRVETATDVPARKDETVALPPYPSRRNRTLEVEEIRLGMLDYIKLYDCDLFALINERNSNLGRIMPISQRLVYEIRFLDSADRCLRKLVRDSDSEASFREQLQAIIATKRTQLSRIFWNATFDSEEMQKAFSLAVEPLGPDDQVAYTNSRQAIEYFLGLGTRLGEHDLTVATDQLEAQYYTLQLHQYGGRLARAVLQLIHYLNAAAYSLEVVSQDRTFCFQGKPTKKARILETVLIKFYGGRIQPYLSAIHQQGKSWLVSINKLIDLPATPIPAAFSRYRDRMLSLDKGGSLWSEFEATIHRHTEAWKQVLGKCGLMPGHDT